MKNFDTLNPIVFFYYFVLTCAICMFSSSLVIVSIALVGAVINFLFLSKKATFKSEIGFFFFFLIMALINPFFVRNGNTVLLFVNDSPITLEAIIYGVFSSGMIVALVYMFRLFSAFMTEDKLLCILGSAFPKLSLVLSGAIRYVSLLSERRKQVVKAQMVSGSYNDNKSMFGRIKSSLRVFSALLTWSLENTIITADSMSARGYGVGRRTSFSLFRFGVSDLMLFVTATALGAVTALGDVIGVTDFIYYPTVKMPELCLLATAAYLSYAVLVLMPTFCKISEVIRWKYLRSRI